MRAIDPVAMKTAIVTKSAVAIAATMKGGCGAEAANMAATKATTAETADMPSATMETTTTKTAAHGSRHHVHRRRHRGGPA